MKSGVLLVNKPAGFTSFDVIAKLRGILHERRLGHTGTLDPMATGVLPVLVGTATKASDILPENEKSYTAGFALGKATDTLDITGTVTETSDKRASREDVEAALEGFRGTISQLPPMYSAVSVGGKRLYDLARQGIEVERTPRTVEIHSITLEDFDEEAGVGTLSISCSKGTYIRSIVDDLGRALGTFAVMTSLVRTSSQGFKLADCMTIDEIQASADIEARIIPPDSLFECYPKLVLSDKQAAMYKNGVRLDPKRVKGAGETGIYRVYGGEFLGLCRVENSEMIIYKNFWKN